MTIKENSSCDGLSDSEFGKQLIKLYPTLRSFARNITTHVQILYDCDDLVQETMMRMWAARSSFTPGTNLRALTFIIMRNYFLSQLRRMKLVNPESYDALADIGLIPGVMGNQEFYVELQETLKAMKKLPVGMQSALALVGAQQYQYNEVANLTSVSLGTVKSRVARGRHRLRVALGTCEPVWQAYR